MSSVRTVSDTALWVAVYRAQESEQADAIFNDPFARRMAGVRGEDIVRTLPFGRSMAWSIVVRTAVMDEIILRTIASGARTVLNLGAGVDTRAFRLDLPKKLQWIDVDLPEMTAYRKECLAGAKPACKHTHVASDLSDRAATRSLIAGIRDAAKPLLVVTEGLLVYLTPAQVGVLARELSDEPSASWWVTDLIGPTLQSSTSRLWGAHLAEGNAPFLFAPSDSAAFFRPLGWNETEFRSTLKESLRLNRPAPYRQSWQWLLASPLAAVRTHMHRMSGIALLERARPLPRNQRRTVAG